MSWFFAQTTRRENKSSDSFRGRIAKEHLEKFLSPDGKTFYCFFLDEKNILMSQNLEEVFNIIAGISLEKKFLFLEANKQNEKSQFNFEENLCAERRKIFLVYKAIKNRWKMFSHTFDDEERKAMGKVAGNCQPRAWVFHVREAELGFCIKSSVEKHKIANLSFPSIVFPRKILRGNFFLFIYFQTKKNLVNRIFLLFLQKRMWRRRQMSQRQLRQQNWPTIQLKVW